MLSDFGTQRWGYGYPHIGRHEPNPYRIKTKYHHSFVLTISMPIARWSKNMTDKESGNLFRSGSNL